MKVDMKDGAVYAVFPETDCPEIKTLGACVDMLNRLEPNARARIAEYLKERYA